MAVLRTSLLTLMLVYTTCCSQSPVSARDQYEAREDWSQPPQLFNEATDQSLKMHKPHRFSLPLKKSSGKTDVQKNDIVPDLQVGCGDGFIVEPTATNKKSRLSSYEKLKIRRRRSVNDSERKKRNYYPVMHIIRTPAAISYSVLRPQAYQISRPYYIPIWGGSGRVPLYFPAQPLFMNPGFPIDNPPIMRGYLPPATSTPKPKTERPVNMKFPSRAGEADDGNNVDDRPVWDIFTRPPSSTTTSRPTPPKRTRKPGQTTTHPPLVHGSGSRDEVDDAFTNNLPEKNEAEIPPPVFSAPNLQSVFRTTTTTQAPIQRPGRDRQPMTCVFAIISCCSATSNEIDLNCFEQRGCPGPFWGPNPCDSKFANAALGSASNYFNV